MIPPSRPGGPTTGLPGSRADCPAREGRLRGADRAERASGRAAATSLPVIMSNAHVIPLGTIDHRAHEGRVFGIREEDLLRHMHVMGKSGMGKSTLLEHVAAEAMERGMGCAVLDPHGDLVDRLLARVPRRRANDLVLLDGGEREHPVGWNPLDARDPPHLVAGAVLGAFKKVFGESWGPRLEHVFRNALLALLDTRAPTLLGVTRLLGDARFRESVVRQARDPLVAQFWTREFASWSPTFLPEVLSPVQNKVGAALTAAPLRLIVGQRRSTVRPADVLATGRILLVRLAKGAMGEEASALLGSLLVAAFQTAAYARASLPPGERHPFLLVVDEFQNFVTGSFAELMAEARKYGLGLVLAHQHLGQLGDGLRRALFGNAGTRIIFSVGAEDAEALAREVGPELDAYDLQSLAPRQTVVRLAVGAETTRPFTARSLPPRATVHEARVPELLRLSRERYGRPRAEVEAAVRAQLLG